MSRFSLNINDDVRVRLTARGRRLVDTDWRGALSGCSAIESPYVPRDWLVADVDGYLTVQLWDLMAVLGPHMRMGADPLVEDNAIVIDTATP